MTTACREKLESKKRLDQSAKEPPGTHGVDVDCRRICALVPHAFGIPATTSGASVGSCGLIG